jgi:hypothetical protein
MVTAAPVPKREEEKKNVFISRATEKIVANDREYEHFN